MLFMDEQVDMWTYLTTVEKPIVIYGMGNGALKTLAKCQEYRIDVRAIFASDEFVRGQSFLGYKIIKYSEVCELFSEFIILLAFGAESPVMLEHFHDLAAKHEMLAPNFPLFGNSCFDLQFLQTHQAEFEATYSLLADEQSKWVFRNICNYKLTGKVEYLRKIASLRVADYQELFTFSSREVYLDLGAYNGDTVREFIQLVASKYQRIIAVEPDYKNYKKLQRWLLESGLANVEIIPKGIWDNVGELSFNNSGGRASALDLDGSTIITVDTVDNILQGDAATLIKMDVEGAELQALRGAKQTLQKYKPKLLVACYHREEDLFRLPLLIKELNPEYQLYFRKHPYIPAWEINIFAC